MYPTQRGIEAIESGNYLKVPGFQEGVDFATAEGYIVPPFDIRECVSVKVRDSAWEFMEFSPNDDTSRKGKKAEIFVKQMLRKGLFPVPVLAEEISEHDMQVMGCDIIVKSNAIRKDDIVIQVKCDYNGGERRLGGTGNLYLQVAEINPRSKH